MTLAMLLWAASILPQALSAQTCLATTVYLEARGQPTLGQMAVAEVALRRRDEGTWGRTVCKVVTAPKQFAPTLVSPNYRLTDLAAWRKAWDVAGQSLANWKLPKNQRPLVVPSANHFAVRSIANTWTDLSPVRVIGDHAFYAVN